MYRQLGHDRAGIAKFLQVTVRTLHNWESGRASIPFAAFKLLRLHLRLELPGASWDGWHFSRGVLWSPEGHGFNGKDCAWLSLLVRQARMFHVLYEERSQLHRELQAARESLERPRIVSRATAGLIDLAEHGALPEAPDGPASGARSAPRAARPGVRCQVTPHKRITGDTGTVQTSGLPVVVDEVPAHLVDRLAIVPPGGRFRPLLLDDPAVEIDLAGVRS